MMSPAQFEVPATPVALMEIVKPGWYSWHSGTLNSGTPAVQVRTPILDPQTIPFANLNAMMTFGSERTEVLLLVLGGALLAVVAEALLLVGGGALFLMVGGALFLMVGGALFLMVGGAEVSRTVVVAAAALATVPAGPGWAR